MIETEGRTFQWRWEISCLFAINWQHAGWVWIKLGFKYALYFLRMKTSIHWCMSNFILGRDDTRARQFRVIIDNRIMIHCFVSTRSRSVVSVLSVRRASSGSPKWSSSFFSQEFFSLRIHMWANIQPSLHGRFHSDIVVQRSKSLFISPTEGWSLFLGVNSLWFISAHSWTLCKEVVLDMLARWHCFCV